MDHIDPERCVTAPADGGAARRCMVDAGCFDRAAACIMYLFDNAEPAAAFHQHVPPNRMRGTTRSLWRATKDPGGAAALVPASHGGGAIGSSRSAASTRTTALLASPPG